MFWIQVAVSTYVYEPCKVTLFEIVQNACFIQVCQVGHILCLFEFRRVHLLGVILVDFQFLEEKSIRKLRREKQSRRRPLQY